MSEFRGRYLEELVMTRFLEQYGELQAAPSDPFEDAGSEVDWDFLERQFDGGHNDDGNHDDGGDGDDWEDDDDEFDPNWKPRRIVFAVGSLIISHAVLDTGVSEQDPYLATTGLAGVLISAGYLTKKFWEKYKYIQEITPE